MNTNDLTRTPRETLDLSGHAQRIMIWWSVAFMAIYVLALAFLFDMVPPPRATMTAQQIADWYAHRHTRIEWGAAVTSWTGAFVLPLTVVVAVQIARLEGGRRVWAIVTGASGVMTSLFLVLPPLFWGVAAFTPSRDPQSTAMMHELGMLAFVAVVPYFIFMWVAVAVFCFRKPTLPHSPFPRWFGHVNIWVAVLFEAGPIAFLTRTGPFAWDGVLVFWVPFSLILAWVCATVRLLLAAIKQQVDEADASPAMLVPAVA